MCARRKILDARTAVFIKATEDDDGADRPGRGILQAGREGHEEVGELPRGTRQNCSPTWRRFSARPSLTLTMSPRATATTRSAEALSALASASCAFSLNSSPCARSHRAQNAKRSNRPSKTLNRLSRRLTGCYQTQRVRTENRWSFRAIQSNSILCFNL